MSNEAANAFISRWSAATPSEGEEANDLIRWLRPEYQNPSGSNSTIQPPLALRSATDKGGPVRKKLAGKLKWPKTMAERVKAVSDALSASKESVTSETMARRFSRADPDDVSEILETLCAMGHAHKGKGKGTYLP
jgi:hypothetical protein